MEFPFFVILSEAKDLLLSEKQILRAAPSE